MREPGGPSGPGPTGPIERLTYIMWSQIILRLARRADRRGPLQTGLATSGTPTKGPGVAPGPFLAFGCSSLGLGGEGPALLLGERVARRVLGPRRKHALVLGVPRQQQARRLHPEGV
jgi:hypothetical protein